MWFTGLAALVFGFLFSWFFVDKGPGLAFLVYTVLLAGAVFALLFYFKRPVNKKIYWYFAPLVFFSGMPAARASLFLTFWNIVLTLGLLIVLANHLLGRSVQKYLLSDYVKTAVILPLAFLGKSFNTLARLFTVGKQENGSRKSLQIARGILITLPVLTVFLILMSSADLVFGKLVSGILSFHFSEELIAKFWFMVVIGFILLGAFTHVLENSAAADGGQAAAKPPTGKFGILEMGILFGTLNALFAIFVFIQIKYLFAGHNAIGEFGYTYAQYAHKGFGELVVMAVLSFLIIFGADKFTEKPEGKHTGGFLCLSVIMTVLLTVIMSSAFARLLVYEQAYGYTMLRVLVQGFIVWLAIIFLWLLYKIVARQTEEKFVFGMFVSALAFFAVLNLMNFDAFVARENINQFAKGNKLDTGYFRELSADAIPEIEKLQSYDGFYNQDGESLPAAADKAIGKIRERSKIKNWQSWNWSKWRNAK